MSDVGALYGRLEVRTNDAEKQIARFNNKLDGALKKLEGQTRQAGDNMNRSLKRSVEAMNQNLAGVGRGADAVKGQVGNLAAQFNDIGTQLAGGQSPFLIAIQQGTQISQVLGPAGARGAVAALGGAFASVLSPINLGTIAVIALGGALVQYVTSGAKDVKSLDDGLKTHADLIGRIREKYGEAAAGLDNYVKESASVLKLQAEAGVKAATETLKSETKNLADAIGSVFNEVGSQDFGGARAFRASEAYAVLTGTVEQLTAAGKTGEPVIADVRAAITALAAANPANEAIQTLAGKLLTASDSGFQAEQGLSKAKQVINTLGSVASGQVSGINQLNSALRELTQIAVPALNDLEKATESYQKALSNAASREERDDAFRAFQGAQDRIANQQAGARAPIPSRKPSPLDEAPPSLQGGSRRGRQQTQSQFPTGGAAVSGFVNDVVYRESGGNRFAKNPDSSATGLGQFIESTWLSLFKQNFPDQAAGMSEKAILMLRSDAAISRQLIEAYAEENAAVLRQAGVAVNQAALQLSHFLGAGDAAKVLSAAPGTKLQGLISSASIAANPTILGGGRTVDDAIRYGEGRVSGSGSFVASKEEAKAFKTELKEINTEARQVDNAVSGAVRGLVDDLIAGKSAGEAFANVLQKIGSQLLDKSLSGLFNGGGGSGGIGGFLSSILGGGSQSVGGLYANGGIVRDGRDVPLKRFAKGGISRSAAIFGEAGAEAAVPLPDGRRIPVDLDLATRNLQPPEVRATTMRTQNTFAISLEGARGNAEIEDAARRGAQIAIQQSRADLQAYGKQSKLGLMRTIAERQARE